MFPASVLLSVAVSLHGVMQPNQQRYSQYIDDETAVVKRPEGYENPYGDGVWRSSWFYASLLVIQAKSPETYNRLKNEHGVDVGQAEKFLRYFRDNCMGEREWKLPKSDQKFSRDQLSPMLYLLASVHAYAPELRPIGKDILANLVSLDRRQGAVSNTEKGAIDDNLRYVIDVLADKYGVDYLDGTRRRLCKIQFGLALRAHSVLVQVPSQELATMDDFSVFNALGLVTLQCIMWGKDDGDVRGWRANYRQHADRGWGPGFRIVSGRSIEDATIDSYQTIRVSRSHDNDIILAQRPHKYLSGVFPPQAGDWLVLDYVILKGLRLAWQ